jgi:hypothetical protein
LDSETLGF